MLPCRRDATALATDRLPFVGYHMPFPSVGFIEKIDQGYRFVPETYQFEI